MGLDFSKAFQLLPHDILIKSKYYTELREHTLGGLKISSLTSQHVVVNGGTSMSWTVSNGLPEDWFLMPFNLFINFPDSDRKLLLVKFAWDTKICVR